MVHSLVRYWKHKSNLSLKNKGNHSCDRTEYLRPSLPFQLEYQRLRHYVAIIRWVAEKELEGKVCLTQSSALASNSGTSLSLNDTLPCDSVFMSLKIGATKWFSPPRGNHDCLVYGIPKDIVP